MILTIINNIHLISPLPVSSSHHSGSNLHQLSNVRTTERRHASLAPRHHVFKDGEDALVLGVVGLVGVVVVVVAGEVWTDESEECLYQGHGSTVHHQTQLLARVGEGEHPQQTQQEPEAGQDDH